MKLVLSLTLSLFALPLFAQQKACCQKAKVAAKEKCVICEVKKCKPFQVFLKPCKKCTAKKGCAECKKQGTSCCLKCSSKAFNPKCKHCQVVFVTDLKCAKKLKAAYSKAKLIPSQCKCKKNEKGLCVCQKKGKSCQCGKTAKVVVNFVDLPKKCQKCVLSMTQGKHCPECKKK